MNNNDEKKLSKSDFFELREKRLKLVYRILYVIVAIWIATLLGIGSQDMTKEIAPMYAFLLAASSQLIINIIKYALMEFRCMKVSGNTDDSLLRQAEERYDNIWRSFSFILSFNAFLMLAQIIFASLLNTTALIIVCFICVLYFFALSCVELLKKGFKDKTVKFLDFIGLTVGGVAAYSICALLCEVNVK